MSFLFLFLKMITLLSKHETILVRKKEKRIREEIDKERENTEIIGALKPYSPNTHHAQIATLIRSHLRSIPTLSSPPRFLLLPISPHISYSTSPISF